MRTEPIIFYNKRLVNLKCLVLLQVICLTQYCLYQRLLTFAFFCLFQTAKQFEEEINFLLTFYSLIFNPYLVKWNFNNVKSIYSKLQSPDNIL